MRCAQRLRVGLEPAPATLSLIESVGEPRLKLDVNWDPETIPAFLALPACEAHGRSLPVDPYLLEPLEHYLRTFGVEVGPNASDVLERLRAEHDAAIIDVRRSRAHDGPALGGRGRARRRAAPVPARRGRLRAEGAPDVPRRRAGARQDRAGARRARGRRRLSRGGDLPGEPEAQLAARDRALAAGALDHGGERHRRHAEARRHHDPQLRHRPRPPRAAVAGAAEGARARRVALRQEPARQAHDARCGGSPRGCPRARCGSR